MLLRRAQLRACNTACVFLFMTWKPVAKPIPHFLLRNGCFWYPTVVMFLLWVFSVLPGANTMRVMQNWLWRTGWDMAMPVVADDRGCRKVTCLELRAVQAYAHASILFRCLLAVAIARCFPTPFRAE